MRRNDGYQYNMDGVRNIADDVVHAGGNDAAVSAQQAGNAAREPQEPVESKGGGLVIEKAQQPLPWRPETHTATTGERRIPIGNERFELAREGGLEEEKWGAGKTVLIFTMDSLAKFVAAAARGGPAGEIKIRESLMTSLTEAGVQVTSSTGELSGGRTLSSEWSGCVFTW